MLSFLNQLSDYVHNSPLHMAVARSCPSSKLVKSGTANHEITCFLGHLSLNLLTRLTVSNLALKASELWVADPNKRPRYASLRDPKSSRPFSTAREQSAALHSVCYMSGAEMWAAPELARGHARNVIIAICGASLRSRSGCMDTPTNVGCNTARRDEAITYQHSYYMHSQTPLSPPLCTYKGR